MSFLQFGTNIGTQCSISIGPLSFFLSGQKFVEKKIIFFIIIHKTMKKSL